MTHSFTGIQVLAIGQATVDKLKPDLNRPRLDGVRVGGKALNQAIAARRLGADVQLATAIGNDPYADDIRAALRSENVGQRYVITAGGGRRHYSSVIVELSERPNGDRQVAVLNESPLQQYFEAAISHIRQNEAPDILMVTFELPEIALENVLQLGERLRDKTLIVVNPAPARHLPNRVSAGLRNCHLLVPNAFEAEMLLESTMTDPVVAANDLRLAYGAENVCITLGSKGCAWASPEASGRIPSLTTTVTDKVGASDSFVAAAALAIRTGQSLEQALKFATVCASISVSRSGGYTSSPALPEVDMKIGSLDSYWTGADGAFAR